MTSKTEGRAFADATGVPLLVKYDTRLRENVAKNIVQDVTMQVQVRALCCMLQRSIMRPTFPHARLPACASVLTVMPGM